MITLNASSSYDEKSLKNSFLAAPKVMQCNLDFLQLFFRIFYMSSEKV